MSDDRENVRDQVAVDSERVINDRTDAVHGRLQPMIVRCDNCDSFIVGHNIRNAIKNHFNSSHPSNRSCNDCEGKIFVYRTITKVNAREISHEFEYHKCSRKEKPKKGASKEKKTLA